MPTWARAISPVSMRSSQGCYSPAGASQMASPARARRTPSGVGSTGQARRRPSSAPAVRTPMSRPNKRASGVAVHRGSEPWPSHGLSQRRVAQQACLRQPQVASVQSQGLRAQSPTSGGHEQRPWMAGAIPPDRHFHWEEDTIASGPRAATRDAGLSPAFTPPTRAALRQTQMQSGSKQRMPAGRGASWQEAKGKPWMPQRSPMEADSLGLQALDTRDADDDSVVADLFQASAADSYQLERSVVADLEKENSELHTLAQRLQAQLAVSEQRERWYRSTAEELEAGGRLHPPPRSEESPNDDLSVVDALALETLHRRADRALLQAAAPPARAMRERPLSAGKAAVRARMGAPAIHRPAYAGLPPRSLLQEEDTLPTAAHHNFQRDPADWNLLE